MSATLNIVIKVAMIPKSKGHILNVVYIKEMLKYRNHICESKWTFHLTDPARQDSNWWKVLCYNTNLFYNAWVAMAVVLFSP